MSGKVAFQKWMIIGAQYSSSFGYCKWRYKKDPIFGCLYRLVSYRATDIDIIIQNWMLTWENNHPFADVVHKHPLLDEFDHPEMDECNSCYCHPKSEGFDDPEIKLIQLWMLCTTSTNGYAPLSPIPPTQSRNRPASLNPIPPTPEPRQKRAKMDAYNCTPLAIR